MKFRDVSYSFAGLIVGLALSWSVACGDQPDPEPDPTFAPAPPTTTPIAVFTPTPSAPDIQTPTPEPTSTPDQNTHTRGCADCDTYCGYTETGIAGHANTGPQIAGWYSEPGKRPEHRASGCTPGCISRAFELGPRHSVFQANASGDRTGCSSAGLALGVRHMLRLDNGVADILPVQSTRRR